MKKLLNTLYVTTPGASLNKDGANLVARVEDEERARVPLHLLAGVVVFGAIYLSPALIAACAEAGICLVLLDRVGRFQARIEGPVRGNVLLRRAQYRVAEDEADTLELVRSLVLGKLVNQRQLLLRARRDHGAELSDARRQRWDYVIDQLAAIGQRISGQDHSCDTLRGHEGEAARLYFELFPDLVRSPDAEITFRGRSRRPPLDPVNAVLSFLYTLLTHDCRSACEAVGLDPAVGFLHRDRPGRPSLALDLMEELRPLLADNVALSLINRRQLRARDFDFRDGGAVWLNDEGRKTVLAAWQEKKQQTRQHEFIEETVPLGLLPYVQAQLLSRHLRGDLDAYPPCLFR